MKSNKARIVIGIILLASVFVLPWWAALVLMVASIFFGAGPEVLVAGILLDATTASSIPIFYDFQYVFTVTSIILLFMVILFKKQLISYS